MNDFAARVELVPFPVYVQVLNGDGQESPSYTGQKHKKRGPEAALSKFSLYIQNIKLKGVKWQFFGIYICLEINGLQEIGEGEGLDKIWRKTTPRRVGEWGSWFASLRCYSSRAAQAGVEVPAICGLYAA